MQHWVSGILGSLVVAGIVGLVAVYGNVGRLESDMVANRREIDVLTQRARTYGEAIARLEERSRDHCGSGGN